MRRRRSASRSRSKLQKEIECTSLRLYRKGLISNNGIISDEIMMQEFYDDIKENRLQEVKIDQIENVLKRFDLARKERNSTNYQFNMSRLKNLAGFSGSQNNLVFVNTNYKIAFDIDIDKPNDDKIPIPNNEVKSENNVKIVKELANLKHVTTVKRKINLEYEAKSKSCFICRLDFLSEVDFAKHFELHGKEFLINIDIVKDIEITIKTFDLTFQYDPNNSETIFILKNISKRSLNITNISLYHNTNQNIPICRDPVEIKIDKTHKFSVRNSIIAATNHNYSILVLSDFQKLWEFIDQHHFMVKEIAVKEKRLLTMPDRVHKPIGLYRLPNYPPPKEIKTLVHNNFNLKEKYSAKEKKLCKFIKALCNLHENNRLNRENYVNGLQIMNFIQDYNIQFDMAKYRADDVTLSPAQSERMYKIKTSDFASLPINLAEGDMVKILILSNETKKTEEVWGTVTQIEYDYLIVEMDESMNINFRCKVRLAPNRLVVRMELNALSIVEDMKLNDYFFPDKIPEIKNDGPNFEFDWFNKNIARNLEQVTAVKNIVKATAFPAPYILFGPPGTGKTSTLVEAIAQIWKLKPKTNILVTAQSNAACNEVAVRLLKYIQPDDIFRFFPKSAEKMLPDLDEELKNRSNLKSGTHRFPSWNELYASRIIICTLTNCGRLVQARIKPGHFDYVMIDECGSASESNALVSIAGIITGFKKVTGTIVLSGDPKQLGPVIRSNFAQHLGLGMSMMERLMNLDVYKKDAETQQYNNLLITKLLQNYRSHKSILKFSNDRFYDGELITKAPPEIANWGCNWGLLPNKSFPILFHSSASPSEKQEDSTSLFNRAEIDLVQNYLNKLFWKGVCGKKVKQSDIGVISPYALQVQKIKQMCAKRNWNEVEVGSVEQFQGREKQIIILSTARSHTPDVGFLNNVKRLNVAVTRAKSLLIVIGNPETLQKDKNWFELIKYFCDNEATCGEKFDLKEANIIDEAYKADIFNKFWNILV